MRSPVLGVDVAASQLTSKERAAMRADAVAASSAVAHLSFNGRIVCIKWAGDRSYAWDCGPGGWSLLWKCYRLTARENEGRFSLGRAVNRWRLMPSIRKAAGERVREELAAESDQDLEAALKASLRDEPTDSIAPLRLVDPITQETLGGEHDERTP